MEHIPVLLKETIEMLQIQPEGIYLDLTAGRGGHSKAILSQLTSGQVHAFDQDKSAIDALIVLQREYKNLFIYHQNFSHVITALKDNIRLVDGILMDLGVSSPQFDVADRGFSYRLDGPLDMRMDQQQLLTAKTILHTYDLKSLTKIFREYGDETFAYPIAKAVIATRLEKPLHTTLELVDLIKRVKPGKALQKKGHPAKQVFQALRIAVNDELNRLSDAIDQSVQLLKPGARLAIISFHSGEDRIVKTKFKSLAINVGTRTGIEALTMAKEKPYKLSTPSLIKPTAEEIKHNHRSESATLRVLERRI
jgi:16S rRNA (cytosine1402-N4)-methyltransferase